MTEELVDKLIAGSPEAWEADEWPRMLLRTTGPGEWAERLYKELKSTATGADMLSRGSWRRNDYESYADVVAEALIEAVRAYVAQFETSDRVLRLEEILRQIKNDEIKQTWATFRPWVPVRQAVTEMLAKAEKAASVDERSASSIGSMGRGDISQNPSANTRETIPGESDPSYIETLRAIYQDADSRRLHLHQAFLGKDRNGRGRSWNEVFELHEQECAAIGLRPGQTGTYKDVKSLSESVRAYTQKVK